MPAKATKPESNLTFEAAVERLEGIVEAMEGDKLTLTDLLVRYEEGTTLVKFCQEQLAAAERKIEIITRNAKGEPQVEAFDPEKAASSPAPSSAPAAKAKAAEDISLF